MKTKKLHLSFQKRILVYRSVLLNSIRYVVWREKMGSRPADGRRRGESWAARFRREHAAASLMYDLWV